MKNRYLFHLVITAICYIVISFAMWDLLWIIKTQNIKISGIIFSLFCFIIIQIIISAWYDLFIKK